MKEIDTDKIGQLSGKRLQAGETFCFRCYPDIGCFNLCCRNLNLFLYPYDVVRLKKRLEISSDRFLEDYTDAVLREGAYFPEVLLRMADNAEKSCPFLTDAGCSVYPDRPDTCRSFPVEYGLLFDENGKAEPVSFFRPPDFCLGRYEKQEYTPETWADNNDAHLYHHMTLLWSQLQVFFQNNPWGSEGPKSPKAKMAFMAAYNIDRFRDFVFHSSFLKRYKIKNDHLMKFRRSDTELLKLGFDWIRFYLWGIKPEYFKVK